MRSDRAGIGSALLASVCCVGPVALAALGLGGLGLSAFIGQYHWYFIGGAALVLGYAWYSYLKERRRCGDQHCEMVRGRFTGATLTLASVAVAAFFGLNVYSYAGVSAASQAAAERPDLAEVVIPVDGMTCFTCTITVEHSLQALEGVSDAAASVPDRSVKVSYDPDRVTVPRMVAAVNETGYRARLPEGKG